MKALLAIPALFAMATPSVAGTIEPSITYERGAPTSIRACGDAYMPFDSVCFNQVRSTKVGFGGVTWFEREVNPAIRVRCRDSFVVDGVRAQVAREYCPQVEAGTLAPAPFLIY